MGLQILPDRFSHGVTWNRGLGYISRYFPLQSHLFDLFILLAFNALLKNVSLIRRLLALRLTEKRQSSQKTQNHPKVVERHALDLNSQRLILLRDFMAIALS